MESLLITIAILLRSLPGWVWFLAGVLFACLGSGGVLFLIAVYGGGAVEGRE